MPTPEALYQEVLQDARELLRRSADSRGRLRVSREVAAMLEALQPPASAAVPAAAPVPAPAEPERAMAEAAHTPVPAAASEAPKVARPTPEGPATGLDDLAARVEGCTRCGLCHSRRQTVFGIGNPQADLVFVGEAPGADEDRQGKPFVGLAGQLLTDIIEKGMKLQRDEVYICNVIKCRPPMNRNPNPEEIAACEPYLVRQLELIRPKVICALGRYAAQTLLRTTDTVGRLRGSWHDYHGIPCRVTYHPAYLLRNPEDKRATWLDIQEVMKALNADTPSGP